MISVKYQVFPTKLKKLEMRVRGSKINRNVNTITILGRVLLEDSKQETKTVQESEFNPSICRPSFLTGGNYET